MSKTWVVARREYLNTVKTKMFVISIVLMPVLACGGVLVQLLAQNLGAAPDRKIAVIDFSPHRQGSGSGSIEAMLMAAADARNQAPGAESLRTPARPAADPLENSARRAFASQSRYTIESVAADSASLPKLRVQLSDRISKGELHAFVEIGPAVLTGGEIGDAARLNLHSKNLANDEARSWVSEVINAGIRQWRASKTGLPPETLAWVTQPVRVQSRGLIREGAASPDDEIRLVAQLIAAFVMTGLMFFIVMFSTMPLLHGCVEEKQQRIAEILIASVPPFELMLGKLLAATLLAFTVAAVYLVGGSGVAWQLGFAGMTGFGDLVWFAMILSLAVPLQGSLLLAVGSACTDMKEAQTAVAPISLAMAAPAFCFGPVLLEPESAFAVFLSIFPLSSPAIMTLRRGLLPELPLWQPVLAILLLLLTTLAALWAAGRIFRVGMLVQGKRASFGEMLRWVAKA